MNGKIRWGILGTGTIAHKFAEALKSIPDAEIAAVGSRAVRTARQFAERYEVPCAHDSYAALAEDPEVDVIYVATPHPMHRENSIDCLRAGKAVLCEKPISINAHDTADMIRVAREEGRFLMEAMWTRFLPAVAQARTWVREGAIGEVRQISADFGFRADIGDEHRLLNPQLAGGSLLDVGVYPIALSFFMFGAAPERVTGLAALAETRVDEQAAYVLQFGNGGLAFLSSAVRTETPQEAVIVGTDGAIRLAHPFWCATRVTLERPNQAQQTIEHPHPNNGYEYEALHVMEALREGRTESDVMPLDESLAIMEVCDALRAQWGVHYPMEH